MSIFIMLVSLWLADGTVMYTHRSFDAEDACYAAATVAVADARAKFDAIGYDAKCVQLSSDRSQKS